MIIGKTYAICIREVQSMNPGSHLSCLSKQQSPWMPECVDRRAWGHEQAGRHAAAHGKQNRKWTFMKRERRQFQACSEGDGDTQIEHAWSERKTHEEMSCIVWPMACRWVTSEDLFAHQNVLRGSWAMQPIRHEMQGASQSWCSFHSKFFLLCILYRLICTLHQCLKCQQWANPATSHDLWQADGEATFHEHGGGGLMIIDPRLYIYHG